MDHPDSVLQRGLLSPQEEATPGDGSTHSTTFFSRISTFGVFSGWGWGHDTEHQDHMGGMSFTRGITEALGLNYESDEAWTRSLIDSYIYGEEKSGREGDIPMPEGFARERRFWRLTTLSGVLGVVVGVFAVGFMNAVDYTPTLWVDNGDFDEASDCNYYAGKLIWIAIPAGTGFVVGVIRWLVDYPFNLPGLFAEIRDYHVEPKWTPWTFVISATSLAGGASLGPEQALSNLGGGMATYIAEHYPAESMDSDDRKLLVLSGMAAALGALFPTPLLGVLMIHELGNPPRAYMESIVILSAGACVAFVMYFWLIPYTKIELMKRQLFLTYSWDFEVYQCGTAVVIGIISGLISLTQVIIIGICKQIFTRIRLRLERNKFWQNVMPPIVGGLIVGSINYCLPLTVGNGGMVMQAVVKYGHNYVVPAKEIPEEYKPYIPAGIDLPEFSGGVLEPHLLIASAFAKLFVLGVSMNCGFVGGFVFPTILVGTISGVLFYQWQNVVPLGMCLACFIAAVPAGICPMPFTLAGLAIFTLFNGLYQTVPIYIAVLVSYTVVCGSGIFKALQLSAMKREKDQAAAAAAQQSRGNSEPLPQTDEEEKSFAINQYLGSNAGSVRLRAAAI